MTGEPSPSAILEVRGLDVRFATPDGEVHAVRNLDFTVAAGETVAIVGRNSSGKYTWLQIICGILAPSEGSVEVNGRIAA